MNVERPPQVFLKRDVAKHSLMRKSVLFGGLLGAGLGALFGAALGAVTATLAGALAGLSIGLVPGILAGALTAAFTVKIAGTTGGIGAGYFTGMVFGALFGMVLGALIPASWWTQVYASGPPILQGLTVNRFESVMHISFLFSILATMVGVWVAGKNQAPGALHSSRPTSIDQYDLVEIIQVPEEHKGLIEIGDVGVVVEIDDNQSFEIECLWPDGSYKWLETLHSRYIRLKHKIPDNR